MVKVETTLGTLGFEMSGSHLVRIELRPKARELAEPGNSDEKRAARTLAGYAAGEDGHRNLSLSLESPPAFTLRVLTRCMMIPHGEVVTYAELARRAGRPRAARAVGRIMASNPLPIVIPCHRVVAGDGSLHGYGGGLEMKRRLLELEGVEVRGSGSRARVMGVSRPGHAGRSRRATRG